VYFVQFGVFCNFENFTVHGLRLTYILMLTTMLYSCRHPPIK